MMDFDDRVKVKQIVGLLYDTISIYGFRLDAPLSSPTSERALFKKKLRADREKLFELYYSYVKRAGFGSWKDLYKFKINAFFSHVMKQVLPPKPIYIDEFPALADPSFLVYGRGKRFLHNMKADHEKLVSLAQTIAQSKKGAPPVHKEKVKEANKATFEQLTSEPVQSEDFCLTFPYNGVTWHQMINRPIIEMELRRTVREIFRRRPLTPDDIYDPFFPSTSSNYNYSRRDNGAVGAFYENFPEFFNSGPSLIQKDLGSLDFIGRKVQQYGALGVRESLEILEFELEHGLETKQSLGVLFDDTELQTRWREFYDELWFKALGEEPRTKCIGLPEPLKVRVITAGPPLIYSALKPIQKWMWKTIKEIDVFSLVGTPISKEFIERKIGKLGAQNVFVSGDYKASTDNLHSWVSECLCRELIILLKENSPDVSEDYLCQLEDLMLKALTGHIIEDPTSSSNSKSYKAQKEGQLMGSIISFPFLCLANAALCRFALEVSEGKTYKIIDSHLDGHESIPLGINGDDCVFQGHKDRIFDLWQRITNFAGLTSSVGKTFVSTEFLTMNSVQFKYIPTSFEGWEARSGLDTWSFEEQKYCNMALVYGQEKSGIREKNACTLGSLHRELKKTCPPELFNKASVLFIDNHRRELNQTDVPWYIPEWLGGRGLEPHYRGDKYQKCSKRDRLLSTKIRQYIGDGDIKLTPCKASEAQKWQMHQLVKKDNAEFQWLDNNYWEFVEREGTRRTLEDEASKFYKSCIIDLLFTKDLESLENVICDSHEKLRRAESHNQRVWFKVREIFEREILNGRTVFPCASYEDLLFEKKESHLACFDVRID